MCFGNKQIVNFLPTTVRSSLVSKSSTKKNSVKISRAHSTVVKLSSFEGGGTRELAALSRGVLRCVETRRQRRADRPDQTAKTVTNCE